MSKSLLDLLNKTRGDIASKRGNNIDLTRLKDGNCRFNWSTQQLCENMGLRRFFE